MFPVFHRPSYKPARTRDVRSGSANNQISTGGYLYDNNGNLTTMAGTTLVYDVRNRAASISPSGGGTEKYSYAPDNARVWKQKPDGHQEICFSARFE
jgi:hypothetical protein